MKTVTIGLDEAPVEELTPMHSLVLLRPQLAKVAQKVYDNWNPHTSGPDVSMKIAQNFCNFLFYKGLKALPVGSPVNVRFSHTLVKLKEGVFVLDIDHARYRLGVVNKIPDVEFNDQDVQVVKISTDPQMFQKYTK